MKATIAVETALLIWFAIALAKVENELYAWEVGMCMPIVGFTQDSTGRLIEHRAASTHDNHTCLEKVQTRTSWVWHLWYALLHR
jgi:hypothetical protein